MANKRPAGTGGEVRSNRTNQRRATRGREIIQPRAPKRGPHGCEGNEGTCGAYPVKGTHLCVGHSRSQGK